MKNKLLIIGAGIYALVANEIANDIGCFDKIDFIDDNAKLTPNGIAVIGTTTDIAELSKDYENCIVAIGNPDVRLLLMEKIEKETNCNIISLISPRAYIAPSAKIEKGCVVEPMTVIHTMCRIGIGCFISAGAVVNHASVIGDGCHIDCNATVLGNQNVPAKTKICSGEVFCEKHLPTTPVPVNEKVYRFDDVM